MIEAKFWWEPGMISPLVLLFGGAKVTDHNLLDFLRPFELAWQYKIFAPF